MHSSNVPLVLKLKTGSISAQYHVVFDDCFSTVASEAELPQAWEKLFRYQNQTWDQNSEADDEPSRFKRESLEVASQQQRESMAKAKMDKVDRSGNTGSQWRKSARLRLFG